MFKAPTLVSLIVLTCSLAAGPSLAGGLGPIIHVAPRLDQKAIDIGPINPVKSKPTLITKDIGLSLSGKGDHPSPPPRSSEPKVMVSCSVSGAPPEMRLTNLGSVTIPAGTRIKWRIASSGLSGAAVFTSSLPAGRTALLGNVLPRDVPAATACSAAILT